MSKRKATGITVTQEQVERAAQDGQRAFELYCDRELLELAAKAGGIEIVGYDVDTPMVDAGGGDSRWGNCKSWSPLTDDGDALRLAADLNLHIQIHCAADERTQFVAVGIDNDDYQPYLNEDDSKWLAEARVAEAGDKYAATRLAIVRAAAAIGAAMP